MIGGQKTAAAALLISVFVVGAMGGAVGTRFMDQRAGHRWAAEMRSFDRPTGKPPWVGMRDGGFPDRGLVPMWISDRLAQALDLSEEQQGQVKDILERSRERAEAELSEVFPRLRAELDSMYLEVRTILTPEQQGLFDEFRAREEERMFQRRPGPWPDESPGGSR